MTFNFSNQANFMGFSTFPWTLNCVEDRCPKTILRTKIYSMCTVAMYKLLKLQEVPKNLRLENELETLNRLFRKYKRSFNLNKKVKK